MGRPDWDSYFFRIAAEVATRATCPRASIGAVLVKNKRIIGAGYNGVAEGQEHCPSSPEHLVLDHCRDAVHAEYNALANALVPAFGATLYVVGARRVCPDCADRLRENGVTDIRHQRGVSSLDTVLAEVNEWQAVTFPRATPSSVVAHLKREVDELAADPTDTGELADVIFLVVGLAYELGLSMTDLAEIVAQKLAINRKRTWGEPDADGVVEHVRAEVPS
jgi:dCMP deaminase